MNNLLLVSNCFSLLSPYLFLPKLIRVCGHLRVGKLLPCILLVLGATRVYWLMGAYFTIFYSKVYTLYNRLVLSNLYKIKSFVIAARTIMSHEESPIPGSLILSLCLLLGSRHC